MNVTTKSYLPSLLPSRGTCHQWSWCQWICLHDGYSLPSHIVQSDLRPDVVLWDDANKFLTMLELTVPFETGFEAAQQRKEGKYLELLHEAGKAGYKGCLITLEMGSHGLPHMQGFKKLQDQLLIPRKEIHSMLVMASRAAQYNWVTQDLVYLEQNFSITFLSHLFFTLF